MVVVVGRPKAVPQVPPTTTTTTTHTHLVQVSPPYPLDDGLRRAHRLVVVLLQLRRRRGAGAEEQAGAHQPGATTKRRSWRRPVHPGHARPGRRAPHLQPPRARQQLPVLHQVQKLVVQQLELRWLQPEGAVRGGEVGRWPAARAIEQVSRAAARQRKALEHRRALGRTHTHARTQAPSRSSLRCGAPRPPPAARPPP